MTTMPDHARGASSAGVARSAERRQSAGGAPSRPTGRQSPGTAPSGPAGRRPRTPTGPTRPSPATRLERLVWTLVHAFLEVEAGRRPRSHLRPVMCPVLYARLSQIWIRSGPPGAVVRIRGDLVADDCYEAVAVVRRSHRVGAVSVRLLHTPEGWRIADLGRPEDGPLPAPPYAFPTDDPDGAQPLPPTPPLEAVGAAG